jgi:hypothetical protein
MIVTKEWLKERSACNDGVKWFEGQKETDGVKVVEKLIKEKQLNWANWLVVRLMSTHKMKIEYAVFAAERVIEIYEKEYPNDKRPRQAIEAAKVYIKDPNEKNRAAAYAAYAATYAATYASDAAAHAAYATYAATYAADAAHASDAAAHAAYATAHAAYATYAADAATYAATYASDAAAHAAYAAIRKKILEYGLSLLEGVSHV